MRAALRKIHVWATLGVALPLPLILGTGILLLFKKHWAWVQPPTREATVAAPTLDWPGLLGAVRQATGGRVQGWDQVDRVDVRPSKGLAKVQLQDQTELQVDLGTGTVLQVAPRRSDLLEGLHAGDAFGGVVKYGLYLGATLLLLAQFVTGLILLPRALGLGRRPWRFRKRHRSRAGQS